MPILYLVSHRDRCLDKTIDQISSSDNAQSSDSHKINDKQNNKKYISEQQHNSSAGRLILRPHRHHVFVIIGGFLQTPDLTNDTNSADQ